MQLLVAEEVWICPYFGARTEQAAAAGAPVEFVIPKEGGLSLIWNTSIIADRPKESIELAEKFVNTTLEAEKQIAFARLTGYPPTNMEAMKNLPPDLKKLALTDEQSRELRQARSAASTTWRCSPIGIQIRDRWNKEVLGS